MYISNYSIIFHQIRITIPINASGARSFNKPVIYTSSIVYATESRSFLPSLREAYRRFKRAFDYKSVMGSLSTSRVWSKAHRSKRTSSIGDTECVLVPGNHGMESTSCHPNHFHISRHCQGWTKRSMDLIVDPPCAFPLPSPPRRLFSKTGSH